MATTIERENLDAYQHEALPDSGRYIRLLELERPQTWAGSGIRCRLTTWPLDKAPVYHAISYTWGDPTPRTCITLARRALRVPDSSASVLKMLAYFNTSRYYWIDAICIAQGDIHEKNKQVASMGRIFRQAQHVLVCLQPFPDKSEETMHMISEIESEATITANSLAHEPFHAPWDTAWKGLSHEKLHMLSESLVCHLAHCLHVLGSRLDTFVSGLAALSMRPYFQRMWIVQELFSAMSASICCGKARIPVAVAETYLRLASWIERFLVEKQRPLMQGLESVGVWLGTSAPFLFSGSALVMSSRAGALMRLLRINALETQATNRLSPAEAIMLAAHRQCADARDTIYSILDLTKWPIVGPLPIRPDYEKSAYHLAIEILRELGSTLAYSDGEKLIANLRISERDSVIKQIIAQRQDRRATRPIVITNNDSLAELVPPSITGKLKYRYFGKQIGVNSHRQRTPNRFMIEDEVRQFWFYPGLVRNNDWVLFNRDYSSSHHYGIFVRPNRDVFEIVGNVYCLFDRPGEENCRDFEVYFLPEDLIILHVIRKLSRARNHVAGSFGSDFHQPLRTSVCKERFSSYARLRPRIG